MERFDENFESNYASNLITTFIGDDENLPSELFSDGTASLPELRHFFDDGNDPFQFESDSRSTQTVSETISNSRDESLRSTPFFDIDRLQDDVGLCNLRNERIGGRDDRQVVDTKNCQISDSSKVGHFYGRMSADLVIIWKDLLNFQQIFINYVYSVDDLLPKRIADPIEYHVDSVEGSKHRRGRRPGRPRKFNEKVKKSRLVLWVFIRNLLLNPEYCPRFIRWEDYEQKIFRFVKPAQVAKLWGERYPDKNKTKKMTYDNFSRALRYWYRREMFKAVPGYNLVYKFGDNATGLETDFPNFDPNYYTRNKTEKMMTNDSFSRTKRSHRKKGKSATIPRRKLVL